MLCAKPSKTPMVVTPVMSKNSSILLDDGFQYKCIVGALQYLLPIYLDISYVVNKTCQYLHSPIEEH